MSLINTVRLIFLALLIISESNGFESDDDNENTVTCLQGASEARLPDDGCRTNRGVDFSEQAPQIFLSLETTALLNQQSVVHLSKIYPPQAKPLKALECFAEEPFPIPVGPTMYFCTLFLILLCWFIKRCLTCLLHDTAQRIELYPTIDHFPSIKLYNLQQSRREGRLRRESRNTWAWMAKKYLLMQSDPKVNVQIFKTTWSDFQLPKDNWGIIRAIVKLNGWFERVRRNTLVLGADSTKFNQNQAKNNENKDDGKKPHKKGQPTATANIPKKNTKNEPEKGQKKNVTTMTPNTTTAIKRGMDPTTMPDYTRRMSNLYGTPLLKDENNGPLEEHHRHGHHHHPQHHHHHHGHHTNDPGKMKIDDKALENMAQEL